MDSISASVSTCLRPSSLISYLSPVTVMDASRPCLAVRRAHCHSGPTDQSDIREAVQRSGRQRHSAVRLSVCRSNEGERHQSPAGNETQRSDCESFSDLEHPFCNASFGAITIPNPLASSLTSASLIAMRHCQSNVYRQICTTFYWP